MPILASADWLILLIYCFFSLSAGFSLFPLQTESVEYLQAGRKAPAWLSGLALTSVGMGGLEVLAMGAAGARYGVASVALFTAGSIPALLFSGWFLMPILHGAEREGGAPVRSIPEYLGRRFDQKTRALQAGLFAAMAVAVAGLSLYAMARVLIRLHVFDNVVQGLNLPPAGAMAIAMAVPAALVALYVLLGGLAAAMYSQLLQFSVLVAALLPVTLLGLKRAGGWSGLKAAAPAGLVHAWSGAGGVHALGLGTAGWVLGAGLALGGGAWCADFRLVQLAMATKDRTAARRAPLAAAGLRALLPLLMVLPGVFALSVPTPRTTITIHNENGAIYHEITVVPAAAESGQGLVPAETDAEGRLRKDAAGKTRLDYLQAMPNVLAASLPLGMLGLGLAALLACLMSGVAASLTALSTVFACDVYQGFLRREASDGQIVKAGRWAAAGGAAAALAVGCAAMRGSHLLGAALLIFAVVNAPTLATLLLGAFWKRTNGQGAFAGLAAGAMAALAYHGTALPQGEQRGMQGGWIAVLHHPANELAQGVWTAALAFLTCLLVTAIVSAATKAQPEADLAGLMHRPNATQTAWWKQPETVAAAAIALLAIAVNLIFL